MGGGALAETRGGGAMSKKNLPPTPAVEAISRLNLTGNVVPIRWCQELRTTGKKECRRVPNHAAIVILADIIYWYRGVEVRDEVTGRIIGLRRKFRADKLQVSYMHYIGLFGYSRSVIKRAVDFLVARKLVTREFRAVQTNQGMLSNVIFLEPIPAQIEAISAFPEAPRVVDAKTPHRLREDPLSVDGKTYTLDYRETSRENSQPPPSTPPKGGVHRATSCALPYILRFARKMKKRKIKKRKIKKRLAKASSLFVRGYPCSAPRDAQRRRQHERRASIPTSSDSCSHESRPTREGAAMMMKVSEPTADGLRAAAREYWLHPSPESWARFQAAARVGADEVEKRPK